MKEYMKVDGFTALKIEAEFPTRHAIMDETKNA